MCDQMLVVQSYLDIMTLDIVENLICYLVKTQVLVENSFGIIVENLGIVENFCWKVFSRFFDNKMIKTWFLIEFI